MLKVLWNFIVLRDAKTWPIFAEPKHLHCNQMFIQMRLILFAISSKSFMSQKVCIKHEIQITIERKGLTLIAF